MAKHGSCVCKYKLNSVTCDSNQNWNNKTCQYECRNYRACKKDLVGILLHVFMRINKVYKKYCWWFENYVWWSYILYVIEIVSKNVANIIPTNVTSTVSINCHKKKARCELDC